MLMAARDIRVTLWTCWNDPRAASLACNTHRPARGEFPTAPIHLFGFLSINTSCCHLLGFLSVR
jgi:hypothetical protein